MASYILLKKLANTQLDRSAISKVKMEIDNVMAEQYETFNVLKNLLNSAGKKRCCRLCLKPAEHWIFGYDAFDIVANIKYILDIEVDTDDSKPHYLCSTCLKDLKSATRLKRTAEATQWRLQQELELLAETGNGFTSRGNATAPGAGYFQRDNTQNCIVREWKCMKCSKRFRAKEDFTAHGNKKSCHTRVRKESICICEICGQKCKSKGQYTAHRTTHQPELRYACTLCPYRARMPAFLTFHMRVHTGERPVRCPHCPMTFARPSNLASHRRRHFPPEHHCTRCDRSFTMKQALERHMMTQHSNLRPHICVTCGKTFAVRRGLRRHELKTHKLPKLRAGSTPTYILLQQQEAASAETDAKKTYMINKNIVNF